LVDNKNNEKKIDKGKNQMDVKKKRIDTSVSKDKKTEITKKEVNTPR
jgi:hypothetical protein